MVLLLYKNEYGSFFIYIYLRSFLSKEYRLLLYRLQRVYNIKRM